MSQSHESSTPMEDTTIPIVTDKPDVDVDISNLQVAPTEDVFVTDQKEDPGSARKANPGRYRYALDETGCRLIPQAYVS